MLQSFPKSTVPAQSALSSLQRKDPLRFLICGAAGDGKSTLLGRMLYDCKLLPDEQIAAIAADHPALLVDRLPVERDRATRIDVVYRSFATARREFLVADTPGHEQYTRITAAAASSADLAVLLIDAGKGLLTQTRRHGHIVALLGIRDIVVVINKMDALAWSQAQFEHIRAEYCAFAATIGLTNAVCIPASALLGDNVVRRSAGMTWYAGPTLLDHLENVEISASAVHQPSRAPEEAAAAVADQFSVNLIWMSEQPMLPGRSYLLQTGSDLVPAQVTELKHKINVDTLEHVAAKHLELNEIAACNLALSHSIAFAPENRDRGGFILIDQMSNAAVACGAIAFPLRRATNIHWQAIKLDKTARAALKGHKPCILWLTGLSAAGKSTIADIVEQALHRAGHHTVLLDGDNIRHGLSRDLGFTDEDRVENIRRVAEVAKLMLEAGLIVIVSFISPFRSERRMARKLVGRDEFIEIYVDTPIEVCEARDPKGLYKLARSGKLPNLTGIGSPYEPPEHAELVLSGGTKRAEVLAQEVLAALTVRGIIGQCP